MANINWTVPTHDLGFKPVMSVPVPLGASPVTAFLRRNKQGAGPPKQDPKCRWFSRTTKEKIAKIHPLLLDP